ncbi:unnamed protein product [Brassica oleracea var. botrytis]|uniref:Cytoplasmic envelopment protein 3 n=4 Tax=Brassica TaxID=3705 RepID=A0ABQ7ERM1_BRACR|nr:hypothetical protein DY000_02049760 [Brassica cretica]KAG2271304.1 hypothetical protein Bca52824_065859 [Brassica carinata]CAF1932353.1 unnamed protein product [Brassica napus]CDY24588.1 BnaC05g32720D [Brassica napus]VDD45646.1 unnamed protein product [Brassica oleracea]
MLSKCCRRCVAAEELAAQTQDGGDDNQGNDAQSAGRSNEAADGEEHGVLDNDHDIDIESDAESVFYSPASGPNRRW